VFGWFNVGVAGSFPIERGVFVGVDGSCCLVISPILVSSGRSISVLVLVLCQCVHPWSFGSTLEGLGVGSLIRWHPRRFGSKLKGLGMGSLIRWLYGASE